MGDGTASAIPNELMNWAYWASGLNKSLGGMGQQVNQAIEEFNRAHQQPRFIGNVDQVGDEVIRYAARNSVIDHWVGKVGQAFTQVDHHGVPPDIYNINREYLPEADLARLVGDNPVKQAEDAANGAELAARLKRTRDFDSIRAILHQLQGQNREFVYHFFNELGPDRTLKTLIVINYIEDDGLLQTFDKALGEASQHPNWDPEFTRALLNPSQEIRDRQLNIGDIQLSMLKYGTFSEDFLTQSADYFLFSDKLPTNTTFDKFQVVFNALDRNPDAAYNYLIGRYQVGDKNLPRVQYLLSHSTAGDDHPGENAALDKLITDAGFSDNGRRDNGNQLLQAIGSINSPNLVANDIRPSIERLLACYIYSFPTNSPPSHELKQLFQIAVTNTDGSVDPGRLTNMQNEVTKWLFDSKPPQNSDQLTDWAKNTGRMANDLIQPVIAQQRAKDDSEAQLRSFAISAGTTLALAAAGVGVGASVLVGSTFTTFILTAPSSAESHATTMMRMQEKAAKASMIINLARHGILHPPVDLNDPDQIEDVLNHQDRYRVMMRDGGSKRLDDVTGDAGDQFSPLPNK